MFGFGGKKSTSQEQNALIDATAGDEVSILLIFFQFIDERACSYRNKQ